MSTDNSAQYAESVAGWDPAASYWCPNCGMRVMVKRLRWPEWQPTSLHPVCRACLDGQHRQCRGVNSAGASCTCAHIDGDGA